MRRSSAAHDGNPPQDDSRVAGNRSRVLSSAYGLQVTQYIGCNSVRTDQATAVVTNTESESDGRLGRQVISKYTTKSSSDTLKVIIDEEWNQFIL